MKVKDTVKLSFSVLRTNKVRSFLTGLGIIIGIASVIVIMSAGAGAQSLIVDQLNSIGTNLIGILPGTSEENGPPSAAMGIVVTTLKYEDAEAIAKEVPGIAAASAYNTGLETFSWQNSKVDVTYYGVMSSYTQVEETEVSVGRFFTDEEDQSSARVVVLGSQVAQELFDGTSPIGQRVKIGKETFEVIGVLKARGSAGFQNKDKNAFMPNRTAQKIMLGIQHVNFIRVKVGNVSDIDRATNDIKLLLRDRHNLRETKIDDFSVQNTKDAIKTLTSITDMLKFFLAAIAGLSLIVGGVGVMNIMLASVNERVREIGLRKAVGARRQDILVQFLAESVTITLFGGLIGIVIGIAISYLVAVIANYLGYNWDFVISPVSIMLGFGVAFTVGLVFGIYPAGRAAKFNSTEALRYE